MKTVQGFMDTMSVSNSFSMIFQSLFLYEKYHVLIQISKPVLVGQWFGTE